LWHYVTLAVGLGVILVLQTSQWFFFDEWAFLQLAGPGLFEPHVGHWSTSPMLVFEALRAVFGLHSYYPFAVVVTLIHLSVAHLAWRIALRSGASPWIATAAATVLIFLGAGAENILWAFQIGFLGAIAFGLLSLWLATAEQISRARMVAILLISVFSLTWAGTSIPLIVATALVLLVRHGWRRSVLFVVVTAGVYLTWYTLFALHSPSNPDTGGFGLHKLFIDMPLFLGVMFVLGYGKLFPLIGLGALVELALITWVVVLLIRKRPIAPIVPAIAMAIAAVVFALLTAFSRAAFAVGGGQASRYSYTLVLLLLPLLAVALSRVAARWRRGLPIAVGLLIVLAGYQAVVLVVEAQQQSIIEHGSDRLISEALADYAADPTDFAIAGSPDPQWAPDLDMQDLIDLYRAGYISANDYSG
jgi:hypothetical protein